MKTHSPSYLSDLLSVHKPNRSLRSGDNGLQLTVPFVRAEIASRAFSVYAPKLINSFPKNIRDMFSCVSGCEVVTIDHFKCALKTFYFTLLLLMLCSFFSRASAFCLVRQT